MPKSTIVRRMSKYKAKLTPERVKEDMENRRQEMLDGQQTAAEALYKVEQKVKGVLGDAPIVTSDYLKYHNFSREVFREQNRHGGGYGLKKEVEILILKYKERGCLEDVLKKIRFEVFGIDEL